MELIDILDEDGRKTGIAKAKEVAHKEGLWHRGAHVWVINSQGEILIQHRSPNMENYPDRWDISVAGHLSRGEDSIAGALREVKEEIGLDLAASSLEFLGTTKRQAVLNNETYFDNEFCDIYLVKLDLDIDKFKKQVEEVSDLRWIKIVDLKERVRANDPSLVPHPEEFEILFKKI